MPRPVQAVLAGCTVLALLIWWRLATSSPLVAPEFCIMLSTLCNAAALYPLSRDRRRGGVRTAFAISCLLSLMMARTLVYAAVLIFTSRVLSPLYWSFEMAGGVLFAFVLAMGEIVAVLDEVHLEVVETNRSLEEAMVGLETAAKVDSLTGLENRYAFYKLLASFGPMSAADGSIAVLDLNNLKKINDTFGHHAGDLALLSVARCLKEIVRASDYVFRWGGDEFVILLRGTTVETARERLTRMPAPEPLDLQRLATTDRTCGVMGCRSAFRECRRGAAQRRRAALQAKESGEEYRQGECAIMTGTIFCLLMPLLGGCRQYVENAPGIGALTSQSARFDRQAVAVVGRVSRLDQWRSKTGPYDYETFYVCEGATCVHVFREEHSAIKNGDNARIRGVYYRAFRTGDRVFYNEIEATEIIALK